MAQVHLLIAVLCLASAAPLPLPPLSKTFGAPLCPAVDGGGAFWTPERMGSAAPRAVLALNAGAPQACAPQTEQLWTNPSAYASQRNLMQTGLLFYIMDDNAFFCSGAIAGNNTVWTAGHCLYDFRNRRWASCVIFVPDFYSGTLPYGYYTASAAYVTSLWGKIGNYGHDYGLVVINTTFPAELGSFPLLTNIDPKQATYDIYGYPSAPPFDGQYDNNCNSSACYRDTKYFPASVGAPCSSTEGAAGGPWVVNGSIVGLTAYRYAGQPGIIYSPYFGADARKFLISVQSANPAPPAPSPPLPPPALRAL